jgi:hypothetical protein
MRQSSSGWVRVFDFGQKFADEVPTGEGLAQLPSLAPSSA